MDANHKPVWADVDDEDAEAMARLRPQTKTGLRKEEDGNKCLDRIKTKEHRKRLRQQYRLSTVHAKEPKWARIEVTKSSEEEEEEASQEAKAVNTLTRFAGRFVGKSKMLPAKHLDFKLLKDPTIGYQQGAISDIKFHPSKPVLITASTAGKISLFQLCEDMHNPMLVKGNFFLQDVAFPKFRIDSIAFFDGANSILASASNHNYCYTYSLTDGNIAQIRHPIALCSLRPRKIRLSADGFYIAYLANTADVYVFILKTMDHVHTFRGSETIIDFCFSPIDREVLNAQAVNGVVTIWSLCQRDRQEHFFDEGCVRATCLETSQNGQFIACGSNTGIVNVYDLNEWYSSDRKPSTPTPTHSFNQLTTAISWIKFSRDAQLIGIGSDVKRMSFRLGHCPTGTVFGNFPAKQEHFSTQKQISCDFSPGSAFCAFGTNEGKTRLYKLEHFDHY